MNKLLLSLAALIFISNAKADERLFTPPPAAGMVWVVISPELANTLDKPYYQIKGKIQWGGYSQSFNEGKMSEYDYVLGFRHTKNDSIPLKISTTMGRIVSITQGNNPAGPYDKVLSGF